MKAATYEPLLNHIEGCTPLLAASSFIPQQNHSFHLQHVLHADDLTLVAETRKELQHMLDAVDRACAQWGMQIIVNKTKILSDVKQGKVNRRGSSQPSHHRAKHWRKLGHSHTRAPR